MTGFSGITSASMSVVQAPVPLAEIQEAGRTMVLSCTGMRARAEILAGSGPATFPGETRIPRTAPYPVGVGWRAGWIQLCRQERAQNLWTSPDPAMGGLLEEQDPYTALDGGEDVARELFCSQQPGFYHRFTPERPSGMLEFVDIPVHTSPMERPAPPQRGTAPFRLAEARIAFGFVLALAARDPEDHVHVLKSVSWTFHLQYRRNPPARGRTVETWMQVPSGTRGGMGNVTSGAPPALASLLRSPPRQSANQLASAAPNSRLLTAQELKRYL